MEQKYIDGFTCIEPYLLIEFDKREMDNGLNIFTQNQFYSNKDFFDLNNKSIKDNIYFYNPYENNNKLLHNAYMPIDITYSFKLNEVQEDDSEFIYIDYHNYMYVIDNFLKKQNELIDKAKLYLDDIKLVYKCKLSFIPVENDKFTGIMSFGIFGKKINE